MDHSDVSVRLGPTLGVDLLADLRPPTRPARMSQRAYRARWDSTPHAIEAFRRSDGGRVAGYTVAGRLSAVAVVNTFADHLVVVRPGRLGDDLAPLRSVEVSA